MLISNLVFAQDILIPRSVGEMCLENSDRVKKQAEIIISKDSIINNRDTRIEVTDHKVDMLKSAFDLVIQREQKKDTLLINKDKEIEIRVKQRNKLVKAITGLSIIEIITLLILFL